MNADKQTLQTASDSLRRVLENTLSAEAALAQWPVMTKSSDKLLKDAYHLLHHFVSDEDIRLRDARYNASQRRALEKCAEDLLAESAKRNGLPLS